MEVNRGSHLLDSGSMGALDDLLLNALGLVNLAMGNSGLDGLLSGGSLLLFGGLLGDRLLGLRDLGLGGSGGWRLGRSLSLGGLT